MNWNGRSSPSSSLFQETGVNRASFQLLPKSSLYA